MKILGLLLLFLACITGSVFGQRTLSVDTNGVVVAPTNFFTTNDIARKTAVDATNTAQDLLIGSKASTNTTDALAATNTAQDLSIASKVSTNNPVFLAAITNLLSSGTAVSVTNLGNGNWRITVIASTGTAASVGADLDDHKTNETAHIALFAGKAGTNDIPDFGTNAAFLSVSNAAINAGTWTGSNFVTATITNGLASTGYVAGVVSGSYPISNPSNYLGPDATNGLLRPYDVTNTLDLSVSPSLTDTVSKAASALQTEADTPLSIWSRVFGFQNMQGVGVHYSNTLFKISGTALDLLTVSGGLSYAINASADKETVYALARTEGPAGRFVAPTNALVATATDGGRAIYAEGDIVATGTVTAAGFVGSGASLTGITAGQVGAVSNTAAGIAAAGGLTNRTYVTATPLDCSPTVTVTRAMIDAAPWGEMSLSLTQACYLVFDPTVTNGSDVATFRIWIKGTNSLTWTAVTNMLSSGSTAAWTNATAEGSWRIFDKNPDGGLRVW